MSIIFIIKGEYLFILYGILILISYFLLTAVLESLYFLLEERLYGKKDLDKEDENKKIDTNNN